MLHNISWKNFIVFIVWLLIGWYCFIAIVYYAKDIKRLIRFKKSDSIAVETEDADAPIAPGNDNFAKTQTLLNDIAQIIQNAAQHKFPKEELAMALQLSVRMYPELQQSAFEVAINQYISQESVKQCSTSFSDDELRMIWRS